MAVRPGYKQTEVGVIPVDWEVINIAGVSDMITVGFVGSMSHLFTKSGVPLLRGQDVEPNKLNLSRTEFISVETHKLWKKSALAKNDVVIVRVGASAGMTCVIPHGVGDANAASLVVVRPSPKKLNSIFLSQLINSSFGKRQIESVLVGGAQPVINTNTAANFKLALPTIVEQRAIATALSDVDALLANLDQFIAKKRDLKQATMQQILTGQTRLPGFSGEWAVKRLGDVADIDPETLGSNTALDYEFNYVSLEDVDCGVLRGFSEQVFHTAPSRARRKLRAGDVLVSTVRPNLQSHLHFKLDAPHWVCSTGFAVVRCRTGLTNPAYLFPHLFGANVSRQIDTLLTGSSYPAINSRDVRALEIPIPPYDEQTAIATVLSDMDTELAALEARRDKTRALKQGMMQELLTGRIRLV